MNVLPSSVVADTVALVAVVVVEKHWNLEVNMVLCDLGQILYV